MSEFPHGIRQAKMTNRGHVKREMEGHLSHIMPKQALPGT